MFDLRIHVDARNSFEESSEVYGSGDNIQPRTWQLLIGCLFCLIKSLLPNRQRAGLGACGVCLIIIILEYQACRDSLVNPGQHGDRYKSVVNRCGSWVVLLSDAKTRKFMPNWTGYWQS